MSVGGRSGPVLTTKSAAAYCGIALQTLYNELSAGTGPRSHKQGRLNAFYEADLDAWLKTRIKERETLRPLKVAS